MARRDKDIIGYMYNDTKQQIREEIAQEVQAWMDNVGPVIGDAGIVKSIVEFIRNPNG